MSVTVDEYMPPQTEKVSSDITVELATPELDVGDDGSIVVVVGLNASWESPELSFGVLTGYHVWIGSEEDASDPPEDEVETVTVRRLSPCSS